MMDKETRSAFVAHIKKLEGLAISGDMDAVRSLGCMVLLMDGYLPSNPDGDDGCEIIDLAPYLKLAA